MADVPGVEYRAVKYRRGALPATEKTNEEPVSTVNPDGPIGGTAGIGITLNGLNIGGVKKLIESADVLQIPQYWEYNVRTLDVDGLIINDGEINYI